jgi:hypothetical protein
MAGDRNGVVVVQYLAELIIENYCMSDIGLTTYAQPQGADEGYREGKPDVSELFEQQELVAASLPGLLPPLADVKVKVEVLPSSLLCTQFVRMRAMMGLRNNYLLYT